MLPGPPISRSILATALALLLPAIASWLSTSEVNVVLVPDARAAGVSLLAAVYSGSADEGPGKEGLAWLTAHVMLQEMIGRAGGLGGNLRVSVGKDVTLFSGGAAREQGEQLMQLFASTMLKPSFDTAVLEQQRGGQRQALEAARHDARAIAREAFDAFVFRGHPYAHAALGRLSSIDKLTRDDLVAFHDAHWRKGNLAFGLSGDGVEPLGTALQHDLAELPDGVPDRSSRPVSWLPRPRLVVVEEPSASAAVALRIGHTLGITRAHPDYFGLKLAALQLATAVPPSIEIQIEETDPVEAAGAPGLPRRQQAFVMAAAPAPAEAADLIRAAIEKLRDLRQTGLDPARLEDIRRTARQAPPFPPANTLLDLAERLDELLFRAPGFAQRYAAGLDAAGAEAVKQAVARSLFPDRVAVVAVVPDSKSFTGAVTVSSPPFVTANDVEVVTIDSLWR